MKPSVNLALALLDACKAVRIAEASLYEVPMNNPPQPMPNAKPKALPDDPVLLADQARYLSWQNVCRRRAEFQAAAEHTLEVAADMYLNALFDALEDKIGELVDAAIGLKEEHAA